MARHTPPEPGRRPLEDVLATHSTCPGLYRCTWAWSVKDAALKLKFIHKYCELHKSLPVVPPLEAWLTAS